MLAVSQVRVLSGDEVAEGGDKGYSGRNRILQGILHGASSTGEASRNGHGSEEIGSKRRQSRDQHACSCLSRREGQRGEGSRDRDHHRGEHNKDGAPPEVDDPSPGRAHAQRGCSAAQQQRRSARRPSWPSSPQPRCALEWVMS